MIIAAGARRRSTDAPALPDDDPTYDWPTAAQAIAGDTTPYAMPTSSPWNAPVHIASPYSVELHPSVVDFHGQPWNGYRFWMAMTPFPGESAENPHILASHDGYTWQVPAGLSNPIHPWPGVAGTYNSDTELVYDPASDRLICYWREVDNGVALIAAKHSANGATWSARSVVISGGGYTDTLSPSVVRRGPGDWWMFGIKSANPAKASVYRSSDPLTGWGAPTFANLPLRIWHAGVTWDGTAYRMIASLTGNSAQYLLSSTDGYNWSSGVNVMAGRAGEWDPDMYRADLAVRDATTMAVWYSTIGGSEIGYTHMPRSLWPAPPA